MNAYISLCLTDLKNDYAKNIVGHIPYRNATYLLMKTKKVCGNICNGQRNDLDVT